MAGEPLRIVLVGAGMIPIPPPGYGAVEKHIWNLSEALVDRGHEVRIVNRVFGDASPHEYRFAWWARREVERAPYDVVHVHTPGVAAIFRLLGPRRFVYTTHSRHWAGTRTLGERAGFFLERRAVREATETIAVSSFVARQIDRRVTVVPNGVDVLRYAPDLAKRTGEVAVGLGEVAAHKKWHLAATAARAAGWREFRVIGPLRDPAYAAEVEKSGGTLVGPVDEATLVHELGRADVLVHPSVSESFGMAVVEGMSAGLPVVCSDLLSFLVRDRQEGFLVPTQAADAARIDAMTAPLRKLHEDGALRMRMGEAARTRAVAEYAWESVAARVEAVYRRAVAAP